MDKSGAQKGMLRTTVLWQAEHLELKEKGGGRGSEMVKLVKVPTTKSDDLS